MRSFDGVAHFLGEFGEQPPYNVVGGKAIRILCFEILLANSSALVDIEKAGVRHSFGNALGFCIKDVEAANDLRIGISQHRKFDFVPLAKIHEDRWTIVANGSQIEPLLLEPFFGVLQLHELRFAEGSPIGGTKEKENCPFWTLQCLVGLFVAELVHKCECRRLLADFEPNWPSNSVAGLTAFLPARKSKQSDRD